VSIIADLVLHYPWLSGLIELITHDEQDIEILTNLK